MLEVTVALLLIRYAHVRKWALPVIRGVVMTGPDLIIVWQAQQFASRVVQIFGAAARKVAASGSEVGVEDGVAAKDVVCKTLCQQI